MSEFDKVFNLFLRHQKYCLDILSRYYPFTKEELLTHKSKLNWVEVCNNENINWDYELLELFQDKIALGTLSGNSKFPFTEEFIDKNFKELFYYETDDSFDRTQIASNKNLPWSEEFIDKYKIHWDWDDLSSNEGIPFTYELLKKYKNRWSTRSLMINKSIKNLFKDEFRYSIEGFNEKEMKEKSEFNLYMYEEHECKFCNKGMQDVLDDNDLYQAALVASYCPTFKADLELYKILLRAIKEGFCSQSAAELYYEEHFKPTIEIIEILEEVWNFTMSTIFPSVGNYFVDVVRENDALEIIMKLMPTIDYDNIRYTIKLGGGDDEELNDNKDNNEKVSEDYRKNALERTERGLIDEGYELIEKAIEHNPMSGLNYNTFGFILTRDKKYEKAIEYFDRAIELNEKNDKFYVNRGYAEYLFGNYEKAELDFNKAKSINYKVFRDYLHKSIDYFLAGYDSMGLHCLNIADKLKENSFEVLHNRFIYGINKIEYNIPLGRYLSKWYIILEKKERK